MKTNAIVRIVVYALVAVVLILLLSTCLLLGDFSIPIGTSDYIAGNGSFPASEITALDIDWAAGSVDIVMHDSDKITFYDYSESKNPKPMAYKKENGTLKLRYSKPAISFGNSPAKSLTVCVPRDWFCRTLDLDGASLYVFVHKLSVDYLNLDGVSNQITFNGSIKTLDCDGVSNQITLRCHANPDAIDVDGVSNQLILALPQGCGFQATVDGLSNHFESELDVVSRDAHLVYGDGACQIDVDGISCTLVVNQFE